MPTTIDLETRVSASREQVSCEISGETVILSLRSGEYFGLNPVGARIWELLSEPRSAAEVRDKIVAEYPDADEAECTRDVLELLQQMADAALIDVNVPSQV